MRRVVRSLAMICGLSAGDQSHGTVRPAHAPVPSRGLSDAKRVFSIGLGAANQRQNSLLVPIIPCGARQSSSGGGDTGTGGRGPGEGRGRGQGGGRGGRGRGGRSSADTGLGPVERAVIAARSSQDAAAVLDKANVDASCLLF